MIPRITPSHDVARSLQEASSQVVWAAHGHVGLVTGTPTAPREAAWCRTTIMKTTWALCTAARKTVPMSMKVALPVKKRHDNLQLHPGTASLFVVTIVQNTVFVTQSRQSKYYCLAVTPSVCLIYSWSETIFLPGADITGGGDICTMEIRHRDMGFIYLCILFYELLMAHSVYTILIIWGVLMAQIARDC
jgi:hypothetical protein